MSSVVIGSLVSILGLLGLGLAANAIDAGMYQFGCALFGFALVYVFWLIKTHFDGVERAAPLPPRPRTGAASGND